MHFVGYIASSLDGFIADARHSLDWLNTYQDEDYGYDAFIVGVTHIVMGRRTFDDVLRMGIDWPYANQHTYVLTRHYIPEPLPPNVSLWMEGVPNLIAHLRPREGTTWIVGGGSVQRAFLEGDALEVLHLFQMPIVLGQGAALWPAGQPTHRFARLTQCTPFPSGAIHLTYAFGA